MWNDFVGKFSGGLKIIVLLLGAIALWLIIMNQVNQLSVTADEKMRIARQEYAMGECMLYGVPDALYFNDNVYCVVYLEQMGADGYIRGSRLAFDLETMQKAFPSTGLP